MSEREQLEQAIAALEAQRDTLGDAVVGPMIAAARDKLAALKESTPAPAPALAGERKLVTVMFADIAGFTALSERTDPETVRELMNGCFNHLVPAIEKYGGTVDKFIGDEIMALFGAPTTHENDPERALRAALEMADALAVFNTERGTNLGMHIGVNTGLVIAGGIGSHGRQQYSVMGDAVNLAARLEDISERGEILVGPDTHRLAASLFEFEPLKPVVVKGKAEPVPVYRLLGARVVAGKARGIAGLGSPLVGRQAEVRALQEAAARLWAGVGGIVTLVGEAGLGKSRLMAELRKWVSQQREGSPAGSLVELCWVEGRCLSYGTSIAYLLWLDVLRGLLGVTMEDAPVAVRDALRERVRSLCPEEFETVYPYLGRLMSLPLEPEAERLAQALEGEELKSETFRAVERLITCTAQQQPLVLVCEDLHWADPTSIDLLERLLALADQAALLLICVFRPVTEHGCWRVRQMVARQYSHHHIDLGLEPLSSTESATLVGNLLRVEDLPSELRQRILARAEGNPFYVEEIIHSLIDGEAIRRDEASSRWHATRDVVDIPIPDTLQGVLMARIDRLHEETKQVLQLAAVIGRIFLYRVLAAIASEERSLDDHLLALQREEMIRERVRLPELEYIFKHHLIQEAAYNGLLKKDRRVFHRRTAEALERLFPDRVDEQIGLLAYHWERAKDPEKATEYLLRAGDQARLAFAHEEAVDFYRRTLAFLQDREGQAARTLMKLGLTYQLALDFSSARQAFEEGFALWQKAARRPSLTPPPAPHPLRMLSGNPFTLDPTMAKDGVSIGFTEQLFSSLVEESSGVGVMPGLARSWEVSEGGRKYIFHLRDDARWSDGAPLTARDFVFAWKRTLDPATGSPNAQMLYDIKGARPFHQGRGQESEVGVEAIDDLTLAVELEGPTGYFLQLLTHSAALPVPQHVVEKHDEAWTDVGTIVSNGPFRLDDYRRDQWMSFSRNPHYRGPFTGNLQRVELSINESQSESLAMYEAGELDLTALFRLQPEEHARIRQRYAAEYLTLPMPFTIYLGFNTRRPPFDDRRVRRAFALALDKEMIGNVVSIGSVSPATGGFVPPGMPGHSPGIGLPYDPEKARRLLAEAGYPQGSGFPRLDVLAGGIDEATCQAFQSQLEEMLEVEMCLEWLNWPEYLGRLRNETPHLFTMGWIADYLDPDNFMRIGIADANRYARWENKAFEELVERARRTLDHGERLRLYQEADRILVADAPIIPLSYVRGHALAKPWVTYAPFSPVKGLLWRDVTIEPH